MKRLFFAAALSGAIAVASTAFAASSFHEARERIYADPLSVLPTESGFSVRNFLWALPPPPCMKGPLADRIGRTVREDADFLETPKPKVLHPLGICAEAVWEIDQISFATGLLATGTRVNALVRFSTGDDRTSLREFSSVGSKWVPKLPRLPRIFGIAVKLFPTRDEREKVGTRNLFLLDQHGLEGSKRRLFLSPDDGRPSVHFTNFAAGTSAAARMVNHIFSRVDSNPALRPLYPLTEVDARNQPVATPATPTLIRLHPRALTDEGLVRPYWDFRDEIGSYDPGELVFDIVLPAQEGFEQAVIGRLTIGAPVVSRACDQELTFQHHPNRSK